MDSTALRRLDSRRAGALAARAVRRPSVLHRLLVLAALASLVTGLLLGTGASPVLSGHLPNADDYMRMVQVFGWLDGAGWSDLREPRMDPPQGVTMHWARLPDIPLAALVGLLEPGLGRPRAALAAAAIVPPLLLVLFLACMAWAARPVTGRGNDLLAAILAVLPLPLVLAFQPGRIDHDNWQLILAAVALGALLRMLLRPAALLPPIVAAGALALALWVGGESLPWLAAFNLGLVAGWIRSGGRTPVRGALLCACCMAALGGALLLLTQPPALWQAPVCDGFGIVYAGIPPTIAVFWGLLWPAARHQWRWPLRAAAALAAGALVLGAFLLLFPECARGPFSQVELRLQQDWLVHIAESQPAWVLFPGSLWLPGLLLAAPLAALVWSIAAARRGTTRWRALWSALAIWLVIAIGLTVLQIRVLGFTFMITAVALAGQLLRLAWRFHPLWRAIVRPALVGLLAPILLLVLPAAILSMASTASRPQGEPRRCDLQAAARVLDDPAGPGGRPRLIAGPIHDGSEILFRTPHRVLGAPYHRNTAGNLDAFDFFAAPDPEAARQIAARRGVELVLFCPGAFSMWLDQGSRHFVDDLTEGRVPPWLRPVPLPAASGALLFEVAPRAAVSPP